MSAFVLQSTHGGDHPSSISTCPCCKSSCSSDHVHSPSPSALPSSDKKESVSKKTFLIDGHELEVDSPILIINDFQPSSPFDELSLLSSIEAPLDSDMKDSQSEGKNLSLSSNSRKKRKTQSMKSNDITKEKFEGIPLPSWRIRESDNEDTITKDDEWDNEENIIEPPDVLIELRHLIHELEEKIRFQWDNKKLIKRLQVQLRRLISLMSNLQYYNINVVYNNTPSNITGSNVPTPNSSTDGVILNNDLTSSTGLGIGLCAEKLKKRRGRKKKNIPSSVNLDSIISDVRARCQKYCDMYSHLSARYSGKKFIFSPTTTSTSTSTSPMKKKTTSAVALGSGSEEEFEFEHEMEMEEEIEEDAFWPIEQSPKEIKQEPKEEIEQEIFLQDPFEQIETPISENTPSDKESDEDSEENGSGDDYISDYQMNEEEEDFEVARGRAKIISKRTGRKTLKNSNNNNHNNHSNHNNHNNHNNHTHNNNNNTNNNDLSTKQARKKRNFSKATLESSREDIHDYTHDGSSPEAILEESSDSFSNESKSRKKQRKPKYYYSFAFSSSNNANLSSPMSDVPNIHDTSASPSINGDHEGPQKITTDLIPFLEDILGNHKETSEGSADDILSMYKSMYSSKASVDPNGEFTKKGKGRRGRKRSNNKLNQLKMTCDAPEWYRYDADGNGTSILDCMSLDFIDMDSYVYVRMCGKGTKKSTDTCTNSYSGSGSSTAASSDSEDLKYSSNYISSIPQATSDNWQAWTLSHSFVHPSSCEEIPVSSSSSSFISPNTNIGISNPKNSHEDSQEDFFVSSLLDDGFGDLTSDFIPIIPQSHSIVVSVSVVPFTLKM